MPDLPQPGKRPVYTHRELQRLFGPRSIAVFGVSPNPVSFGARTIANLSASGYPGRIFRINPRYDRIGTEPCYPSISALPEVPDCAIVSLPREAVEGAVLECAQAGVGGAVLFASSYRETGRAEDIAAQDRLTAIARESGLRITGPNTIGFANYSCQAMVTFGMAASPMAPLKQPGVGIASQSGGIGFGLGQAARRGMPLSHVLTFGNGADVNLADQIAYLTGEPMCRAIACLFEGMEDPTQLLKAGELAWAADKPVVICKIGVGESGSRATVSHTGSLAGSSTAYNALFERAGFIVVPNIECLLETAAFFAKAPSRPASRGVAAIGVSGGALIAAADAADRHHVPLPDLPGAVKERMSALLPDFAALRNPCDLTAMGGNDASVFPSCVEYMLSDDAYGAIVLPQTTLTARTPERRRRISEVAARLKKPICLPFFGGWIGGPGGAEAEADPNLQWFNSLDRCFAALSAWHKRDERRLAEERNGPRKLERLSPVDAKDKAAKLITASKNKTLTEREAKDVLAWYGVPVVDEKLVHSAEEAVKAATSLGLPSVAMVMKVESPDLPHKTEAGVIRLNLKTADEVMAAYDAVMANAAKYKANARINGVLVQPMLHAGTEVMVGAKIDPLFGPLIIAGLGGVFVELLKDSSVELAPITQLEAKGMLARLKGRALLEGFRGSAPVDQEQLADIIVRLAEFASDQQDFIAELDVNPLICSGDRIVAVDALIVRK